MDAFSCFSIFLRRLSLWSLASCTFGFECRAIFCCYLHGLSSKEWRLWRSLLLYHVFYALAPQYLGRKLHYPYFSSSISISTCISAWFRLFLCLLPPYPRRMWNWIIEKKRFIRLVLLLYLSRGTKDRTIHDQSSTTGTHASMTSSSLASDRDETEGCI